MAKYLWQEIEYFGSQSYLAAAGSVIATYNQCEIAVFGLMGELSNNLKLGQHAYALLGTASRLDYLKCAVRTHGNNDLTRLVDTFCLHFNICSENRNLVAHAAYVRDWQAMPEIKTQLAKAPKHKPFTEVNFYKANEDDMLSIANDCAETYQFGMAIFSYILTLPGHTLEGMPPMQMSLPGIPARPSKMNPHPPTDRTGDPSRPQSSEG